MVSTTPNTSAISAQSKLSFNKKRTAKEAGIITASPTQQKRLKTSQTETIKSGYLPSSTDPLTDLKSLLESYTLKDANPTLFDKISE